MGSEPRIVETTVPVEREVTITAPRDLVWAFWTEPARLAQWMGSVANVDLRAGGTVRIETSRAPGGEDGVRLVVADNGPGIPADVLPRISEPFYTTKTAGTGLGLPLSYNIIREHGGRVAVETAAGRGTTFIITLPEDKAAD